MGSSVRHRIKKVLIVAHDAGGAELISSWLLHHNQYQYSYLLEGPATRIFTSKLNQDIVILTRNKMQTEISNCDLIITGTSGINDLERLAISYCVENKKNVITFIDHWCEYKQRFIKNILPNEIWVSDPYAYAIAMQEFKYTTIKEIKNYYLLDFSNQFDFTPKPITNNLNLLYITEPIGEYASYRYGNEYYYNYDEYEALRYFFKCLSTLSIQSKTLKIRIRLHPLEKSHKYKAIIKKQLRQIEISSDTLVQDLTWSDWVIGCSSMVLVQAIAAQKKVFTCIPPRANVFKLPYTEIKPLC